MLVPQRTNDGRVVEMQKDKQRVTEGVSEYRPKLKAIGRTAVHTCTSTLRNESVGPA